MKLNILFLTAIFVLILSGSVHAQYGVNKVTLSPAAPSPCDSITFTVSGDHDQSNIVTSWLTDTLINDTLFFSVHATIPPIYVGGLTSFSFTTKIAPLRLDTFIIYANYVPSIPTFTPNSVTDTLIIDTLLIVDAGRDTSYCDTNFIQLQAIPSPGGTGTWTVHKGNATLNSSTIHDPIASNLSYGENVFIWDIPSTSCSRGNSDTVIIFNSQKPSVALTEADFYSCVDSNTIHANQAVVGLGVWTVSTGNSTVMSPLDSVSGVLNLDLGMNKYIWTISDTNTLCPSTKDVLKVDFRSAKSVTIIRIKDTLLAGSAPNYQWYRDGSKLIGDTSRNLLITQNGTYKVQTNADGCTNGPFSNEIVVDDITIGINEIQGSNFSVYPNPANDQLKIVLEGIDMENIQIEILNITGNILLKKSFFPSSQEISVDVSGLNSGFYLVVLKSNDVYITKRFQKD